MKKFATFAVFAALGGCASTGGTGTVENINSFWANVSSVTGALCRIEPTLATVTDILATIKPDLLPAEQLAHVVGDSICKAWTTGGSVTVAPKTAWNFSLIGSAYAQTAKGTVNGVAVKAKKVP